jgi:hypothetical protein
MSSHVERSNARESVITMDHRDTEGALVRREHTERAEFSEAHLSIDRGETADVVHSTIAGLTETTGERVTKIRTVDGMLVAVLSDYALPSGALGTTVEYRTAPASIPATRKARKIWRALKPYEQ